MDGDNDDQITRDTRTRLIEAAVQAFAAGHYDGVSVRNIEREAGVNRGLVAYHFGSKEELWKAAVAWLADRFRDEFTPYREILRRVSPRERGRVMYSVYTSFCAKHPEYIRLLLMEGQTDSPRLKWIVEQHVRPENEFFDRVVERKGDRDAEAQAITYFGFVGAASFIFTVPSLCREIFGIDPTADDFIERFAPLSADVGFAVQQLVHELKANNP